MVARADYTNQPHTYTHGREPITVRRGVLGTYGRSGWVFEGGEGEARLVPAVMQYGVAK